MNLQPVILCGGSGTRLWPLSREHYPKQLLALAGEDTLLQATARRMDHSLATATRKVLAPIIVGNEDYRFLTAEQLRQVGVMPAAIVLEPVGRNTAPAFALEKAVVSTPLGIESITGAVNGVHYKEAATPERMAQTVLALLDTPVRCQTLGSNARRLILERHTWRHVGEKLRQVLETM